MIGYGHIAPLGGAMLGAEEGLVPGAPGNPPATWDAVTIFSGQNFTGSRREVGRGRTAGLITEQAIVAFPKSSSGSLYVPRGFSVHLIEDVNFYQRGRRRERTLTGPTQTNFPFFVQIMTARDNRSAEDRARVEQMLLLAREEEIAREEAEIAAALLQQTEATALALQQQRQAAALRESERLAMQQRQLDTQAKLEHQEMVTAERASFDAMQQAANEFAASQPDQGMPGWVMPASIAGGGLLLLLLLASR